MTMVREAARAQLENCCRRPNREGLIFRFAGAAHLGLEATGEDQGVLFGRTSGVKCSFFVFASLGRVSCRKLLGWGS